MLDAVAGGVTLIALGNAEPVAAILAAEDTEGLDYRGVLPIRKGNLVAGRHALLDGLPQRTAFDWEYQAFYSGRGMTRSSLNICGSETVVAAVTDNERQIGSALAVVPTAGDMSCSRRSTYCLCLMTMLRRPLSPVGFCSICSILRGNDRYGVDRQGTVYSKEFL
jgi:hypothetical protein